MWSSHQSLNEENGIMADLHHTLRLELHISLNRKLIQNIPMFQMITSSDCLIDLIEKLTPRIFIPGEYVRKLCAHAVHYSFVFYSLRS